MKFSTRECNQYFSANYGGGYLRCTLQDDSKADCYRVRRTRTRKGVIQFLGAQGWIAPDPTKPWSVQDWNNKYNYTSVPKGTQ